MERTGLDLIVCADPANMDYLTGYKGWSFYVPQCVLFHADEEHPVWIGRGQDGAAAHLTTDLPAYRIRPYPDHYVQSRERHPMNLVADYIRKRGWDRSRIGLEMDAYYFSGRGADAVVVFNGRLHSGFVCDGSRTCRLAGVPSCFDGAAVVPTTTTPPGPAATATGIAAGWSGKAAAFPPAPSQWTWSPLTTTAEGPGRVSRRVTWLEWSP